ncbi:MAG TPA: hypothetical protein VMM37_10590, partial [Bacteroidota bacterium]|nr:hypothetical protein [Bacteroidota bacterium]
PRRRFLRRKESSVSLWTLNDYGRQVAVLESDDSDGLEEMLHRLLDAMRKVFRVADEPLVNIVCSYSRPRWTMLLFPRTKHRPEEYFREGPDRIVISPAAVDMGGFIVTPVQADYERVTPQLVGGIFRQVSPDAETMVRIIEAL